MDLLDLTAAELSRKCLTLFSRCLAYRSQTQDDVHDQPASPSQEQVAEATSIDERLEYKLADFNLWIDGIGALASARASLDWRLNERPIDLELVKGNLVMLYQSLEDYADLQEKHQALDEALLDIESALASLASLALAVRRTGKRSRLHKADRLFNEEEHSELKQHLECIVALRPGERGQSSHRFRQKIEVLTPVQQRLVTANLRRRNRFLQARRHSTGLKRRKPELSSISEDFGNQAHQLIASPDLEIPIPAHPLVEQPAQLPKNSDAPTISGTSASVPESKLRYTDPELKKPEASTPRTEVTRITATAHYPRPQLPDGSQHMFQCPCCYQTLPVQDVKTNPRWRKHLSEDICPYTCVVEGCPTPEVYYNTRTALERHIRQDHSPVWQCPLCEDEPQLASMMDMMEHFMALHPDGAEGDGISTLISLSTQRKMGIEACPLCDVEGIVDSPELIDHVLEHVHDFSLRSLPWPMSSHINPVGEVGTFDLGHAKCASVIEWLSGISEVDGPRCLQLCQFDYDRVTTVEDQVPPLQDDNLHVEIYFADEHGDRSEAAETDISQLTQETFSSSSMTNMANSDDEAAQHPDNIALEQSVGEGNTASLESTASRFRNGIKKVFNLGNTKSAPSEKSTSTGVQQNQQRDADPRFPVHRAAMYLFRRLKDQEDTLSIIAFTRFLRQQHPSGREYDKTFLIKEAYDFPMFFKAWESLGTSAQGPLPPKDLSKPLTNYFISTSHNTYMARDSSVIGDSAQACRHILLQGCRYFEIDVWDGDAIKPIPQDSPKDNHHHASTSKIRITATKPTNPAPREPVVTHGWNVTGPCGFREFCAVIASSAFVSNDLPVIVSLQVHTDVDQQEVMVRVMKEEWGELLLDEPLEGYDPRFRLPNLGDLRRKILVGVESGSIPYNMNDPLSDSKGSNPGIIGLMKPSLKEKTSNAVICDTLNRLVVYTRRETIFGLNTSQDRRPSRILSISDDSIFHLGSLDETWLLSYTAQCFLHTFPGNRRVDSGNPDPAFFWRLGFQMVSWNWQNLDGGMMVHRGMFADEDGWVLKPTGYRSTDKQIGPWRNVIPKGKMDIRITIFSGFDIPEIGEAEQDSSGQEKRVLRPQVKVELHCAQDDEDEDTYELKTETGKTKDPQFGANGSHIRFVVKRSPPNLSFVRFRVVDDSGSIVQPLLGWACIRLDRLREGYRLIELFDVEGRKTSGVLLVKMSVNLRTK